MTAVNKETVALKGPDQCPICGRHEFSQTSKVLFVGLENLDAFVYRCSHCGAGQNYYPHREQVTATAYPEDYYSYSPDSYSKRKREIKALVYRFLPPRFLRFLGSRWLTMVPPPRRGRVLDVGCGCGASLDTWKRIGWDTYGIEISRSAVDICRSSGHKVILSQSWEGLLPNDYFDWITLDNVLEHIQNPQRMLRSLLAYLKVGGTLTVCVPNFGGEESELFGPYWDHLDPPHHEIHYSYPSLCILLQSCGFEVSNVSYQARFSTGRGMLNVRQYGAKGEYKSMRSRLTNFKIREAIHLLAGGAVSERFGLFMTVQAKKSTLVSSSEITA